MIDRADLSFGTDEQPSVEGKRSRSGRAAAPRTRAIVDRQCHVVGPNQHWKRPAQAEAPKGRSRRWSPSRC